MTSRVCAVDDVAAGDGAALRRRRPAARVVRIGDDFYAIGDTCSHADYSLSEGDVWADEREIECPKHGSTFSLLDRRAAEPAGDAPGARVRRAVDGDDVIGRRRCTVSVAARSTDLHADASPGHEILRGVDLEVRSGEVHASWGRTGPASRRCRTC